MPKPNFSFEKRQRELKKQQKKQEKQLRKAEMKNAALAKAPGTMPAGEEAKPPE